MNALQITHIGITRSIIQKFLLMFLPKFGYYRNKVQILVPALTGKTPCISIAFYDKSSYLWNMDCDRHSSWTMSNSLLILANEFPEYTIADANDKLLEKIEPFSLACWLDECQVYAWPVEHLKSV